jgi:hypothetical protein
MLLVFNVYSVHLAKEAPEWFGDFKIEQHIIHSAIYTDNLVLPAPEWFRDFKIEQHIIHSAIYTDNLVLPAKKTTLQSIIQKLLKAGRL